LIHISELSHKRVWRASDVLKEGEQVEVQILSVDAEAQRMSLSLKALETKPSVASKEEQKEAAAIAELEAASQQRAKPKGPLKGGLGGPSGGEKFGLKW
jgi:small subunit ribosomal protein S1